MNTKSIRRVIVPGIAAGLALALSGCGAANDSGSDDDSSDSGSGGESLSGTLYGGGSSAQEPTGS